MFKSTPYFLKRWTRIFNCVSLSSYCWSFLLNCSKGGSALTYSTSVFPFAPLCIMASFSVFCSHCWSQHGFPWPPCHQIQRILFFCLDLTANLCCIWCCWPLLFPWKFFFPWISSMTTLSWFSSYSVSSQLSSWPSFPLLAPQMQEFPEFSPQSFSLPICSSWECIRIVLLKNGVKEVLARPSIWLMNSIPYNMWEDFIPYRFSK